MIAENFAVPSGSTLDVNLGPAGPVAISTSGGNLIVLQNGVQVSLSGMTAVNVADIGSNDVLNFNGPVPLPFTFANAGGTTVNVNTGTLTFAPVMGGSVHLGSLSIANSAGAVMTASTTNAPTTLVLNSISLGTTGSLDVTNNEVLINYGSGPDPKSSILQDLARGSNGGRWNGSGITSSVAAASKGKYGVGFADGSDGIAQNVSSGQIEITYALYGDANLDGIVSGDDFTVLVHYLGKSVTGGWENGDFTYSGLVTGDDYTLLTGNLGKIASIAAVAAPTQDSTTLAANVVMPTKIVKPISAAGAHRIKHRS